MHPVLFQLGPVAFYTYGLFVALGMTAAYAVSMRRAKSAGIPKQVVTDALLLFFISGVAGARAFFVWQHFDDYKENIWQIFSVHEGGLVWYGGFLTAGALGVLYGRTRHWPILKLADFFAPQLALGHAIGRIGCFFNGCCFGRVTLGPLGAYFSGGPQPRHPVQLYESALLFLLSLYLFWFSKKKRFREGNVFLMYVILYSVLRFFLEFLRGDQTAVFFLTLPQWTSLILFGGSSSLYLWPGKNAKV